MVLPNWVQESLLNLNIRTCPFSFDPLPPALLAPIATTVPSEEIKTECLSTPSLSLAAAPLMSCPSCAHIDTVPPP